jgi:hypothetical protein
MFEAFGIPNWILWTGGYFLALAAILRFNFIYSDWGDSDSDG